MVLVTSHRLRALRLCGIAAAVNLRLRRRVADRTLQAFPRLRYRCCFVDEYFLKPKHCQTFLVMPFTLSPSRLEGDNKRCLHAQKDGCAGVVLLFNRDPPLSIPIP